MDINNDVDQLFKLGFSNPINFDENSILDDCLVEYRSVGLKYPQFSQSSNRKNYTLEEHWQDISQGAPWFKSCHVVLDTVKEIARDQGILARVGRVFGDNFKLWSSQVITKGPGKSHQWHKDVETNYWNSVNVWIGLENTDENAGLKLMQCSHKVNISKNINGFTDREFEKYAQSTDDNCKIVIPRIHPYQYILFFGGMWHGSFNIGKKFRSSLLLQYSPLDADVKIPKTFQNPVVWHEIRPSCIEYNI